MDPIFDRLGRLIRSNLNPGPRPSGTSRPASPLGGDDFQQEAEDELEAFLNNTPPPKRPASSGQSSQGARSYQQQRTNQTSGSRSEAPPPRPSLDPALAQAYQVLGLAPGAPWETIEAAHRALLKKHHPDRHAGDEAAMARATAESQRINEAFQRIKKHAGR